jgi:hypothetical protein
MIEDSHGAVYGAKRWLHKSIFGFHYSLSQFEIAALSNNKTEEQNMFGLVIDVFRRGGASTAYARNISWFVINTVFGKVTNKIYKYGS